MSGHLARAIEARLELRSVEGSEKTLPLVELVRRHVRPGMTLRLSTAHVREQAVVYELCRQW